MVTIVLSFVLIVWKGITTETTLEADSHSIDCWNYKNWAGLCCDYWTGLVSLITTD